MSERMDSYQAWRGGRIVPGRIVLARSQMGLPQQSIANVCGTDVETVDLWEAGAEYPNWAELMDLMAFTGRPAAYFTRPVTGTGGLFAVPIVWAQHPGEVDALRSEYCQDAVDAAVYGWPENFFDLPVEAFV